MNLLINLLGLTLFLFLFWRRLREDYASNIVFGSGFLILGSLMMAIYVSVKFAPNAWFWISFVGIIIGLGISVVRFNLRVVEVIEAASIASLPWLALVFLYEAVVTNNLTTIIISTVIFLFVVAFYILDSRYKEFGWYTSGKVGFAGLTILGVLMLIRAVAVFFKPFIFSSIGDFDVFFSAVSAFVFFLLVYNLSKA